MAAYSGEWVLFPEQSEDLNAKLRDAMRDPSAPLAGATRRQPAGGGDLWRDRRPGGMRGGGMPGGGMVAAGLDPEVMRRQMEAIHGLAEVPREVTLRLNPELVTFTQNETDTVILTLGDEDQEVLQRGAMLLGSAEWKKEGLEIKRHMEIGAGITDKISVNDAGQLVIEREIELMRQPVEGTLVYKRREGSQ